MKWLLAILALLITGLAIPRASAQSIVPWAVGFEMSGTVTNVVAKGDKIYFQFSGWFYIRQHSWGTTNVDELVKVDCRNGVDAVVSTSNFQAGSPYNNAAAVRKPEDLLPIFKAAAERGRKLTIGLLSPKLDFAGQPFLQDAKIWGITDWDLR